MDELSCLCAGSDSAESFIYKVFEVMFSLFLQQACFLIPVYRDDGFSEVGI